MYRIMYVCGHFIIEYYGNGSSILCMHENQLESVYKISLSGIKPRDFDFVYLQWFRYRDKPKNHALTQF